SLMSSPSKEAVMDNRSNGHGRKPTLTCEEWKQFLAEDTSPSDDPRDVIQSSNPKYVGSGMDAHQRVAWIAAGRPSLARLKAEPALLAQLQPASAVPGARTRAKAKPR